ncbi:MAG: DUF1667 domain-containing protein, partial [Spirochaetales bacterium]|nr:DUF1667 domain-containing protein [Spirochaetales bacterium]
MSEELICITCPMGCHLTVDRQPDGSLDVTGNRCPRGVKYATEELLSPKRVVSATAAIAESGSDQNAANRPVARVPVRSTAAYAKGDVPDLLSAIYALRVTMPVRRGQVLIQDFKGSG